MTQNLIVSDRSVHHLIGAVVLQYLHYYMLHVCISQKNSITPVVFMCLPVLRSGSVLHHKYDQLNCKFYVYNLQSVSACILSTRSFISRRWFPSRYPFSDGRKIMNRPREKPVSHLEIRNLS